jgi:hypothetical protein
MGKEEKLNDEFHGVTVMELMFGIQNITFPDDGKHQVRLTFDEDTYPFIERALRRGQVVTLRLQLKPQTKEQEGEK